jgi:hypothetical protein
MLYNAAFFGSNFMIKVASCCSPVAAAREAIRLSIFTDIASTILCRVEREYSARDHLPPTEHFTDHSVPETGKFF